MLIPHLHDWPASTEAAIELQRALASHVDVASPLDSFEVVAGCDIAYHLDQPLLFTAVVAIRVSDRSVIERHTVAAVVPFPYVPGLLSFREVPSVLKALAELKCEPDVVVVDGQGIAHPRRFGLACHLGLWLERPCLGCAKSWLVGEFEPPGAEPGSASPLTVDSEEVGAVVRSACGARPVFVSPGHRIDVASSVAVVRATLSGYRNPIPTRLAHLAANERRAAER